MTSTLPLTGERTVPGYEREQYWFTRHEAVYRWIADESGLQLHGLRIAEAGSGEGYGAQILSDAGARVIALEYDEQAIAHSRLRYPHVRHVRCNLAGMPLAPGIMDAVVTLQVIEHLWDLRGFLSDARDLLKPGGALIASTPNRITFSPGLGRGVKPTNPFHVEEFDEEQVRDLALGAGFEQVRTLGLAHGDRLAAWRDREGRGIVEAQVAAAVAEAQYGQDWPDDLAEAVRVTTVDDFIIGTTAGRGHDWAQDLIVIGVRT